MRLKKLSIPERRSLVMLEVTFNFMSFLVRRPALRLVQGFSVLLVSILVCASCGKSKRPLVVGSKNEPGEAVVGEIVAQHLENRLKRKVERHLGMAGESVVFQEMAGNSVTLYPTYTGAIVSNILREQPSLDRAVLLERARSEMRRTAQAELLDPLGYENPPVMVVRTADAEAAHAKTLSEAAAGKFEWKIGVSYEFQQRAEALPALNSYKLPLKQVIRGMEPTKLFPMLNAGDLTMIATSAADGRLLSPDYQVLADDRNLFPAYQACLLVRQDALMEEPQLRPALAELSGKLSLDAVRKMSAQVDVEHRSVAEVATAFLQQAGLR
jgi:glycine betaine/choline ABC-type transport system substrate-binding protein